MHAGNEKNAGTGRDFVWVEAEVVRARFRIESRELRVERRQQLGRVGARQ